MVSRDPVRLSPKAPGRGGPPPSFVVPHPPPSLQTHYGPSSPIWTLWLLLAPSRQCSGSSQRPPLRFLASMIHALGLPPLPSPTTYVRSVSPRHFTCRRIEPRPHPTGTLPYRNSGLRHSLAGSPRYTGRTEFLVVRTGRSPPVALPPSRDDAVTFGYQVALTRRILPPLRPSTLSGALTGGNAPGTHGPRPLTLKGSDNPGRKRQALRDVTGFDPFRVGVGWGHVFRGRWPRLLYGSPAGIKRRGKRILLSSAALKIETSTCSLPRNEKGPRSNPARRQIAPPYLLGCRGGIWFKRTMEAGPGPDQANQIRGTRGGRAGNSALPQAQRRREELIRLQQSSEGPSGD
jgi:hypothetical protein